MKELFQLTFSQNLPASIKYENKQTLTGLVPGFKPIDQSIKWFQRGNAFPFKKLTDRVPQFIYRNVTEGVTLSYLRVLEINSAVWR